MPADVASFIQRDGHIGANWNSPPAHSNPLRSTDLSIRCNDRRAIGAGYEETPENFLFSVKGARFITHMKKLREVEVPLANFFASVVLALEEKLGPILWQFPPNFGWNEKRFREFFQLLPKTTGPDCTLLSARRASLASSHAGDREARTETVAQRTAAEGCETRCSQKKIRGARFIRLL